MLSWLKFCYSGSVSVFAHFPFSSRRYGIVIRDILGRKLPDVVEMDEYERLHAIQISNHRTSTFCSAKPIGPIHTVLSRLPNHSLHCESRRSPPFVSYFSFDMFCRTIRIRSFLYLDFQIFF